mgnify:CR=1 FL=1
MNILITGNKGFIGQHLLNTLKYINSSNHRIIQFNKQDFQDTKLLDEKVKKSSVIVHLAGLNRHEEPSVIYDSNMDLSQELVNSIKRVGFKGKLIFASSTQEDIDTAYGNAKKDSRILFLDESNKNNFKFINIGEIKHSF